MKAVYLLLSSAVLLALFAVAASPRSPEVKIPVLPTEKNEFGGRPGSFHFVTNEQIMEDALALQKAFSALDRLDSHINTLEATTRGNMENDLAVLREFAQQVHSRNSGSAGQTAADVEKRLNAAKGSYMCGACHGHGTMHGNMHRNRRGAQSDR